MKYFIDLVNDLKAGRIAPVYLFYGPESYLRREAVKRFREFLLPGGADDFNYTEVDGEETSLPEILALSSMAPLFSEKRLLVVKNAKFFSGKKGTSRSELEDAEEKEREETKGVAGEVPLLAYLSRPSPGVCLIFDAGDHVDRRKKIYKETAKTGRIVEFSLLKPGDLSAWLEKQARLAGKSLSPGTASQILLRAGNSLQGLSVEIKKLIAYTGEKNIITVQDVDAVTPTNPEEDVFTVVDAIGERNPSRALDGISRLVRQKYPPPAILGMVARQIRLILQVGDALSQGCAAGDLASKLGIHPYVARKMAAQQRNFDTPHLIESLHRLHELDVEVKTGRRDFIAGMEMFILDVINTHRDYMHFGEKKKELVKRGTVQHKNAVLTPIPNS